MKNGNKSKTAQPIPECIFCGNRTFSGYAVSADNMPTLFVCKRCYGFYYLGAYWNGLRFEDIEQDQGGGKHETNDNLN